MLRTNNKHSQQHQWFLIPHATLATGDSFRNIGETQVIQLMYRILPLPPFFTNHTYWRYFYVRSAAGCC